MISLFIIIILVFLGWKYQRAKKENQFNEMFPTDIDVTYSNSGSTYVADGTTDNFIIKKDDRFEFLIENGIIVACKDNRRHTDFIYYMED